MCYHFAVMEKRLTTFLDRINRDSRSTPRIVNPGDPLVRSLHYDSRKVVSGGLFFALPGLHTDGHRYIDNAVAKGARAVVHEYGLEGYPPGVVFIQVDDARRAMSALADAFYDHPSRILHTIGVTGTDGKSSTVFFIYQMLSALGRSAGFLSTVRFDTGNGPEDNSYRQSTPEATEIHALLHEMVGAGVQYAVVEATSHGLSSKTARLQDVAFRTAVFTNLSHEHLEFHGSFEAYKGDKTRLFAQLTPEEKGPVFGVVNRDDDAADDFSRATSAPVMSYSLADRNADCSVVSTEETIGSIVFTLRYRGEEFTGRLNMPGLFNLENFLAAFLTIQGLLDIDPRETVETASSLTPPAGRMNLINRGQPFAVIVDYAHTPGSFLKLLPLLQARTRGRLIAVFGSAGERDREKRRQQGEIASNYCNIIVLADEDPRGEEPGAILEEIAIGCGGKVRGKELFLIPDRREAILHAFRIAQAGDTVALLGKGHEKSIIYRDRTLEWNETKTAVSCLEELGFPVRQMR